MSAEETVQRWLGDEAAESEAERALPIAKALRMLRESVGITQTEVARRGGPDFRTISHWETGRKLPSLQLLMRYLTALERDFHDLQVTLDHLANRPGRLTRRMTRIEQRLVLLERWRLEMTTTSMEASPMEEGKTDAAANKTDR